MKTRIISALIGLVILAGVILKFDTFILNLAVAAVLVIAADEILGVSNLKKNRLLCVVFYIFAASVPLLNITLYKDFLPFLIFGFLFLTLLIMLKYHSEISIINAGFGFAFLAGVAVSGSCLIYMRDLYGVPVGLYGVILVLSGAWMSDTGAYFTGVFLGKHKMAPSISPKKTIEGAVGGVVICTLSQLLFSYLYALALGHLGIEALINYKAILLLSPFISLVSIVGDLSASIVKRQTGIKDFGKIMPGHGGVLDRFDSVLMVIPFVYIIFAVHPLITIL